MLSFHYIVEQAGLPVSSNSSATKLLNELKCCCWRAQKFKGSDLFSDSACKSPNETTHGVQSYVDFVSGSRKVIISEGLYPSFKDVLFQSQQPQKVHETSP